MTVMISNSDRNENKKSLSAPHADQHSNSHEREVELPPKPERHLSSSLPNEDDMYPPPQTSRPLSSQQLHLVRGLPSNDVCVECENRSPPDWASVTYGIMLCLDCAGAHRGLGTHLSFVRSLTMDDWTDEQLRRMIQGGNAKWNDFWEEHGETEDLPALASDPGLGSEKENNDPLDRGESRKKIRVKYESNAARAYREALSLNAKACRTKGNSIAPSPAPAEVNITPTRNPNFERGSQLEKELPPSFQDVLKAQAWPFAFSMNISTKSYFYLFAWGVLGMTSAYGVHWWGVHNEWNGSSSITSSLPSLNPVAQGYMGAATSNNTCSYCNLFALGILSLTFCLPYFRLRQSALKVAQKLLDNRQDAFKSARNLLMDSIAIGRAQRLERCDVYYPSVSEGGELRASWGLIFYPGVLIDRTAYAPIASRMSKLGVLVAVANLEPYRLIAKLEQYAVKEEVMHILSDAVLLSKQGSWTVDEWAIGGHSMGGHMAIAAVANEFSSTMKKVVLWGVSLYPDPNTYPCKQSLRHIKDVEALVVNGSNDEIVKSTMYRKGEVVRFEANMPPLSISPSLAGAASLGYKRGHTYYVMIEGGNHAGCAHYGPQMYPIPDGIRAITLEQQQRRMAEVTVDFLLSRSRAERD